MTDSQRAQWIADTMRREGFSALICRLPQSLVMLTGYQPVLGASFCLVTLGPDGQPEARLAVPTDEADLIPAGAAITVAPFAEETLDYISTTLPAVKGPLGALIAGAGVAPNADIGVESVQSPIAAYYTQVGAPGPGTTALFNDLLPGARLRDATTLLDGLSAVKTRAELAWIRAAERAALAGFEGARAAIRAGAIEADVAGATHTAILRAGYAASGVWSATAHVHVMSGPRAADAYKAFNLTSNRMLATGDTVSVQMEVALNGYWAELTRPFLVGEARDPWPRALAACVAAQDAALGVIRAGIAARDVDSAARTVMSQAGFGDAFRHGLGHGFGFQAINHAAQPILHPASTSILRAGMVHNVEPAVYLDRLGGIRLNDNALVTEQGVEVLSSGLSRDLAWLTVRGE